MPQTKDTVHGIDIEPLMVTCLKKKKKYVAKLIHSVFFFNCLEQQCDEVQFHSDQRPDSTRPVPSHSPVKL